MRSNLLAPLAFAFVSTASFAAHADSDCASGAWFCEDQVVEEAAPVQATEAVQVEVSRPVVVVRPDRPIASPPPVVIIITQDGSVMETDRPPAPVVKPRVITPPVKVHRPVQRVRPTTQRPKAAWAPEGGFDIRVDRFGFDSAQPRSAHREGEKDTEMWGGGMSLRFHYRPDREIIFSNGFQFGKDMNGMDRGEVGMQIMKARYFNPASPLHFYGLAGSAFWFGTVNSETRTALTPKEDTSTGKYFASYGSIALQGGLGAEWRFSRYASIHTDLIGVLRWRFASTQDAPEYFDPRTGEASNFFPGILMRTGITFWPGNSKKNR